MVFIVALGILAGTATLVVASVVLDARKMRPDNRIFAVMASLAGLAMLIMTVAWADLGHLVSPSRLATIEVLSETFLAAMSLLFSFAFPRGRTPPRWLWVSSGGAAAAGTWLAWYAAVPSSRPALAPWLLLPVYLLAIASSLRQRHLAPSRLALWLLAGAWLVRGSFGFAVLWMVGASNDLAPSASFLVVAVNFGEMLLIGWLILRHHEFGVRYAFREALTGWLVAFGASGYAALVLMELDPLRETFGDGGTVVAISLLPLMVAWALWTWRDTLLARGSTLDPRRALRREVMERVLSVTRHVVDAEAVLAMIRAAMLEVFPNAKVDFRRSSRTGLLHEISATLPAEVENVLEEQGEPVVDLASWVQRFPRMRQTWPDPSHRILLPVRRGGVLYGAFDLETEGRADADGLLTASAMADHLAVKLENLSLSSSLGRAGRELESIRTFLEDLIESLPVGVVGISGPHLEVRIWNPFEAKRSGIPASEVLGKPYLEQVAARHVEQTIADAILENPKEPLSFPNVGWSRRSADAVDVTVAPLHPRAGAERGFVLILVDATERNALHREVDEFRRLAALGEFAAAIAHDIRTPLSSIRMSVQILRSKVDLPPEDMEYFDLTLEAISRLGRDVEELLDFTKPAFLRVDVVPFREVAQDACDAVFGASSCKVRIELEVPPELDAPIDETQVRKMLVNLLHNAVQASDDDGCVWLEARRNGDDLEIVVRDEGRGIDPSDLERIWDPFFTTRTDGTGLGLALVRKTVTAHGGRVAVESEPGRGTRFEVVLPARRETEVLVPIGDFQEAER